MKRDAALQMLMKLLEEGHIRIHSRCVDELIVLLNSSIKGSEKDFFRRFVTLLIQLNDLGKKIVNIDNHERLSHAIEGEWYSLHIHTKYINLRILSSFIGNEPVLLACFNEKSGKRKSSYQNYLSVLPDRLKEMEAQEDE